mmetsp:Transcript_7277/g.13894  ORF Transcript_7277/g.13894 Transcript_7277/m.13894 type:complete len:93 (+) Transcript_7277:675-953(+)
MLYNRKSLSRNLKRLSLPPPDEATAGRRRCRGYRICFLASRNPSTLTVIVTGTVNLLLVAVTPKSGSRCAYASGRVQLAFVEALAQLILGRE